MKLIEYFSNQAKKPSGIFGKYLMSLVFDKGNSNLNSFVRELLSVQKDDHILEIGFGTGKLIYEIAEKIKEGHVGGIDFSETMVSIAKKRNKKHILSGKVKLTLGNFNKTSFNINRFNKVCTVNTLYFWPDPGKTLKQIAKILQPEGLIFLAFEDIHQLKDKPLDPKVFRLYTQGEAESLLINTSRFSNITTKSRNYGSKIFHCITANKASPHA